MKKIILLTAAALSVATVTAQTPMYLDTTKSIDERVEDALSRMTLEEKVALFHAYGKFASAGVPRLGIPQLMYSDSSHGIRAEVNWNDWGYSNWTNDSCTAFPALTALAATWNPEMAAIYGKAIGEEARYRGKDVLLGPGVNIFRTPLNGRNFEYLGEDPYLAGELAVPYVKEVQKNGVATCVKHFALNNQEIWRGSVDVTVSDRALYEIYLPAFKRALVEADSWTVMGAYNRIWSQHACHNERLLNTILRQEWGWPGVVVTDWGGTHDTRQAALYGLDVEMGSYTNGLTSESDFGYNDYYLADPYMAMLKSGSVPMNTADEKARRVLRLIFLTSMNTQKPFGSFCSPEHYATAKTIGDESIILLKNNGLLPLLPGKAGKILVIGDNASRLLTDGGGSTELKPKDYVTPLDAIKAVYGADNVDYACGYETGRAMYEMIDEIPEETQQAHRAEALAKAANADVIIYVGGLNKNAWQDCESTDRKDYNLPYGQDALIADLLSVNPNMIVANMAGTAYAMPWIDSVPALLHISYLGTMGGASIADVISGKVNPSGKLPYTIGRELSDWGSHSFGEKAYPGVMTDNGPKVEYTEDILVGYRWFEAKGIKPLFPFGYGSSYTTFALGKPAVSAKEMALDGGSIEVTVSVANTGSVEGKEVVQLYLGQVKPKVLRAVKELKGFNKVSLQPGQTADVTFTIKADDLKRYDEDTASWVVDPGKYNIYVGTSSADTASPVTITLK